MLPMILKRELHKEYQTKGKQFLNIHKRISFYIALLFGLVPFSVFIVIRRLLDLKGNKGSY